MTTTAAAGALAPRRPARADLVFRTASLLCGLAVLVVLALVTVSMTAEALPAFRAEGLGFLTSSRWAPNAGVFGALAFVYGTLVVSAIGLALAVPVSIGIALFLAEVAPRRLRRPVAYLVDLLAAIPSVVYGLWGILVLAPAIVGPYVWFAWAVVTIPLLSTVFCGTVSG